jgi:hypothetical protein
MLPAIVNKGYQSGPKSLGQSRLVVVSKGNVQMMSKIREW